MSDFFKAIGAGLTTALPGFLIGGPIGAMAGFGIGMTGAAQGMKGKSGTLPGALIGGLAGMAFGPGGAVVGGLLGALGGKFISKLFKPKEKPPQQAPFYPPMPPYMGGYGMGMGMPGMGMGMGMPGMGMGMGMGMPGMQMGMGMGMGMSMPMMPFGGMQMSMGMFGGFGMQMGMGMNGSMGMQGMGMWGMQQPVQGGQLSQEGPGKPINYTTSGGYKVNINGHTVTITDPTGKNTVKHWGDPHEDFNGKTIKDWQGKDRTLILGDGTKITMDADHPQGVVNNTSIYDGNQAIQIKNGNNTIQSVSFDPYQSRMKEMMQPDGETSYVGHNQKGEFVYANIYNQDKNLGVTPQYKLLGKGNGFTFPQLPAYNQPQLFWM